MDEEGVRKSQPWVSPPAAHLPKWDPIHGLIGRVLLSQRADNVSFEEEWSLGQVCCGVPMRGIGFAGFNLHGESNESSQAFGGRGPKVTTYTSRYLLRYSQTDSPPFPRNY